ncbi:MAG TPA: type II toxin-antitoxin system VapC family toxin [Thermoanaerobaculia bacterium]|nr:type II toxin-antitoxin system VapC family toxin [Thermoanaerobaculia bacterium]
MKLLLDTHIFLWYITEDLKLPAVAADAIRDKKNEVLLSVVSVWEIVVKYQLGKLSLPYAADHYVRDRRVMHQIASLGLEEASIGRLLTLPALHRDPFDRLLICQAIQHDCVIITVDQAFAGYPVNLLPAL